MVAVQQLNHNVLEELSKQKLLADIRIARTQTQIPGWSTATTFIFNPKAGGTAHLAPAVAAIFPHAKHLFMYRACHAVRVLHACSPRSHTIALSPLSLA